MGDPHIHVERKVLHAGFGYRNLVASMLGRAVDAPAVVTTGCGIEVPYAMTSPHPELVTCLACREHAHAEHRKFADQVAELSAMPGLQITASDVAALERWHRDRAERFRS